MRCCLYSTMRTGETSNTVCAVGWHAAILQETDSRRIKCRFQAGGSIGNVKEVY